MQTIVLHGVCDHEQGWTAQVKPVDPDLQPQDSLRPDWVL